MEVWCKQEPKREGGEDTERKRQRECMEREGVMRDKR